ncbi:MAG: hypothetical protein C0596_00890 [Marinilabiliales bacterium]|nr:MAG: hypothetical protein C0596_00890 [Marinilabiliales bacterium]
MKFFLLSSLIVIFSIFQLNAQEKNNKVKYHTKYPKGFKFIPPGTFTTAAGEELSIQGFWMSNEVTNKEFNEFYQDIKQYPDSAFIWLDLKNSPDKNNPIEKRIPFNEILKSIEDTTYKFEDGRTLVETISDKKLSDYPVSGITYEMAKFYCNWKSAYENKMVKADNYISEYRLPTDLEWEYAASQDYNDIETNSELTKSKKGKKNQYKLCHFNGNVSEFVKCRTYFNKVYIKGSSIDKKALSSEKTDVADNYRNTSTGFRIVRTFLGRCKSSDK